MNVKGVSLIEVFLKNAKQMLYLGREQSKTWPQSFPGTFVPGNGRNPSPNVLYG
jgi:hypothetical protein